MYESLPLWIQLSKNNTLISSGTSYCPLLLVNVWVFYPSAIKDTVWSYCVINNNIFSQWHQHLDKLECTIFSLDDWNWLVEGKKKDGIMIRHFSGFLGDRAKELSQSRGGGKCFLWNKGSVCCAAPDGCCGY